MNPNRIFEKMTPARLFLFAAIPGGISMLASSLYGILDGMFVGRILGEASFAALNLAFPFVIVNFSLADLIGVGSSVPISIRLGEKRTDEANNLFSCACLLIVLTGALMGGVLFFLAPYLIHLLGARGELAQLAVDYMRVYALCSPVTTIVFAMDNYLRICGKIQKSMHLNILMSVLSAALEFIFLAVFRWEIGAAALATCCGMMICAGIALVPFAGGRLQLRFCRPHFTGAMLRQILVNGSPNFLSNIAGRITSIVMNAALLRFGGAAAVSIYGVLMYTGDTFQSFLYGVCDSLQPAVGYNWGAGRKDRVKAIERYCYIASAALSVVAAGIMLAFPASITALFVKDTDEAFMAVAVVAMRLFSLTFVTRWISFATQSFMTAVGRPVFASVLSIAAALICPLGFIVALWPLGLNGIWLNSPLTYACAAVLAIVILHRFGKEERSCKSMDG